MNKVYKIIWNRVRGCYMVVSEIAHNLGKASIKKGIITGTAFILVGISPKITLAGYYASNISVENLIYRTIKNNDQYGVEEPWYGYQEIYVLNGHPTIYHKTSSTNWKENGYFYNNGHGAMEKAKDVYSKEDDITYFYEADGKTVIAAKSSLGFTSPTVSLLIGPNSTASNGIRNIVLGFDTTAENSSNGIVIGRNTKINGNNAIAIGYSTSAMLADSLALGTGSIAKIDAGIQGYNPSANTENTDTSTAVWKSTKAALAIGDIDNSITRQITGVAAGTQDTDAVNVAQLRAVATNLSNNNNDSFILSDGAHTTVEKTSSEGKDTYKINVSADGIVTNGNTGLMTGDTIYTEVRPADGSYIKQTNTTAENLTSLDSQIKTNADNITNIANGTISDGLTNTIKTLSKGSVDIIAGTHTTVEKTTTDDKDTYIINVTADGKVAAGDTNIITGETVNTALQNIKNELTTATDTSLAGKANTSLDNITDDGKTVITTLAKGSVKVVSGANSEVIKSDVDGIDTYTVNVKADGTVAKGDTKIVSGDTVNTALNTVKDEITKNEEATNTKLANKTNVDASNITDTEAWGGKLGTGTITETDSKLVTGKTLYTELRPTDGNYVKQANITSQNLTALDTQVKSNTDTITNINDGTIGDGLTQKITELSQGAVEVTAGDHAKVDKTSVNSKYTYKVSVLTDGTVAAGDTNIVTGDTVNTALQNIKTDLTTTTETSLAGKANTSLDNITDSGKNVITNIAKGSMNVISGTNSEVVKNNVDGVDTYTINVKADGAVAKGDAKIVSGDTVNTAIENMKTEIATDTNKALDNKVDIDASNVKDIDSWGKVLGTGTVASDDGKLISGKTLYTEVRPSDGNYIKQASTTAENLTSLDTQTKANADSIAEINNGTISDGLTTTIKNLSKGSIDIVNGEHTIVEKTSANDKDTYKINVAATGKVTEGNNDLVSGGTVYAAINNMNAGVDDKISKKADADLNNITDSGKQVIKDALKEDLDKKANTDASNIDVKAYTDKLATGKIEDGNTGLVSGGIVKSALDTKVDKDSVYTKEEVDTKFTETGTALNDKADTDLKNLTEEGRNTIKDLVKGSVEVTKGNMTSITKTTSNGVDSYKVDVVADGKVADGDKGLVTGGSVYTAVKNISSGIDEKISNKVDVDLNNISSSGKQVIKETMKEDMDKKANTDASNIDVKAYTDKLAIGKIEDGNTGLVSGGTVFAAISKVDANNGLIQTDGDTIAIGNNNSATKIDVSNSNGEGRVISGVKTDMSDESSAANVGYVNAVGNAVAGSLQREISNVQSESRKGIAGASALAALHPLDYDPENKVDFAVGFGNYKGENAAALGMYYRPNERVMFSVGGSMGNGNNAVNAGVSFKLGKSSGLVTNKAVMAREINSLKKMNYDLAQSNQNLQEEIAKLKAKDAERDAQIKALMAKIAEINNG